MQKVERRVLVSLPGGAALLDWVVIGGAVGEAAERGDLAIGVDLHAAEESLIAPAQAARHREIVQRLGSFCPHSHEDFTIPHTYTHSEISKLLNFSQFDE